jgi:hypothetical protein
MGGSTGLDPPVRNKNRSRIPPPITKAGALSHNAHADTQNVLPFVTLLWLANRRFLSIDCGWLSPNVLSLSPKSDVYRFGTLSCLALRLRRKVALLKMLPSLAEADLAYILLRTGRKSGCGSNSLQRPRTSSGLGLPGVLVANSITERHKRPHGFWMGRIVEVNGQS